MIAAASTARPAPSTQRVQESAWAFESFKIRIRQMLWPCPEAWGGVAATLAVLWVVNLSVTRGSLPTERLSPQVAQKLATGFQEQQRLMAELELQPHAPLRKAQKPETHPGERSDQASPGFRA
jgi:hypothetical protein